MKYLKYLLIIPSLFFIIFIQKAYATWSYNDYTINYNVVASGMLIANAGPDQYLPQPQAGLTVTGSASGGSGTISSSTWSYIGCTLPNSTTLVQNCPKAGIVLTPNATNSSTHTTTLVNMDGAAAGTHFRYQYTATDSLGATASDLMDVIIIPAQAPDLTATYNNPTFGIPGAITLTGTVFNAGSGATGNSFTSYFEVQGDPTLTWTSPGITLASGTSQSVSATRSFNPATTTTYPVRLCADGANTVAESNETNNCSAWASLTINVSPPPPPPPTSYTITSSAGANGSITPNGTTTVTSGGSQNYTFSPAPGFTVASVVVDGASVGSPTSYTFSNVTANHTISVTFSATSTPPQCSDGKDNDGNGKADYNGAMINGVWFPPDPGCSSPTDNTEAPVKPIFIEF